MLLPLLALLTTAAAWAAAVYAMDVRGSGESQPDICGRDQFLQPYGSDYFLSGHALMLGRPYLGQKTHDVLRVLDWLRAQGHEEIHLAGRGWEISVSKHVGLLQRNPSHPTRPWLDQLRRANSKA